VYLYTIRNAQNKATMKLITKEKCPHAFEILRGTEGQFTVSASLSKDTAQWNWQVRMWYTTDEGIHVEQLFDLGHQHTKAEAREELETVIAAQLTKTPWLG